MPAAPKVDRTRDLLTREAAGQLTPAEQTDIGMLRQAGEFPAAETAGAPGFGTLQATPGAQFGRSTVMPWLMAVPPGLPAAVVGTLGESAGGPLLGIPATATASAADYGVRSLYGVAPEEGFGPTVAKETALYGMLPPAIGSAAKLIPGAMRYAGQGLQAASLPGAMVSAARGRVGETMASVAAKPAGRLLEAAAGPVESLVNAGTQIDTNLIQQNLGAWAGALTSKAEKAWFAKAATNPVKLGELLSSPATARVLPPEMIQDLTAVWKAARPTASAVLARAAATRVPSAVAAPYVPSFSPF